MELKYTLNSIQKINKNDLLVTIDLYSYATELYNELKRLNIISRIQKIPQLGIIKVKKALFKTRFDYVMLQLYLHKLIKIHLSKDLRLSYNNVISSKEFREDYIYLDHNSKPSMGDILQLLSLIYNIGHFYNTFTASCAITILAEKDTDFYNLIINACNDERYKNAAKKILENKNYQRLHLLNSILILERCDKTKKSVSLALEILYAYINEKSLSKDSKLEYIFKIFKNVRTISYIAYDLQIAKTPLRIDLCNKESLLVLLKELLSEYNNSQSSEYLISSIAKLLDDTVYNKNSKAICYYRISRKMVSSLAKNKPLYIDYYNDLFKNELSILNNKCIREVDYVTSQILKLTFTSEERYIAESLLLKLDKINNIRVGYYDRHSGETTILVSLKKKCDAYTKIYAAYKTLKCVITHLRKLSNIAFNDAKYLLTAKFFLFYLLNEHPIVIKQTISKSTCVICTRGKSSRKKEIESLIKNSIGNEDENYEVKFLLSQLINDTINDTTIIIPASIIMYRKDSSNSKLCEFDGIIVHPYRSKEQVIFLEAKNRSSKPSSAKKCLIKKFKSLSFDIAKDKIETVDCNAYLKYSINKYNQPL